MALVLVVTHLTANATSPDDQLHQAVYQTPDDIRTALAAGANPNAIISQDGGTALHVATWLRDTDKVQALLENPNTNPNILNKFDTSPLSMATYHATPNVIRALLADPRVEDPEIAPSDKYRQSAFGIVITFDRTGDNLRAFLESTKINPNGTVDTYSTKPVECAIDYINPTALRILLQDPRTNYSVDQAIKYASKYDWTDDVRRIAIFNALLKFKDQDGQTGWQKFIQNQTNLSDAERAVLAKNGLPTRPAQLALVRKLCQKKQLSPRILDVAKSEAPVWARIMSKVY
jgi:ankyrin repeat protein